LPACNRGEPACYSTIATAAPPQRFVWVPTVDPGMPDTAPAEPEPWQWPTLKQDNPAPELLDPGPRVIDVCDQARAEIDASHLARARGAGDPLDGHRLLCQLKVAAALGLLDGRTARSRPKTGSSHGSSWTARARPGPVSSSSSPRSNGKRTELGRMPKPNAA
jgi:hypothetical protein